VKSQTAKTNFHVRSKRTWFTAAALLPLLGGCSTDDLSSLWFNSSQPSQSAAAVQNSGGSAPETTATKTAAFDQAACGLFFGQDNVNSGVESMGTEGASQEISLDRSPQENLLQAISYDMDGNYEAARKLYVWLTATPPDVKIDLDCGQGIKLSGNINGLAQRRLVSLDSNAPEYARSAEIETVVAAATVQPGPELPDPPQVERDRRFYETGGVVEAEPEDSVNPTVRMDMEVSDNTAQLTRVERRAPASAPAPTSKPTMATSATQASPPQPKSMTPVVITEAPTTTTSASPPAPTARTAALPVVRTEPATIAGDAASVEHTGAVVASTSRPVGAGELEIADTPPQSSMIELPITSNATPARTAQAAAPSTVAPAPVREPQAAPMMQPQASAPYYAVQLAAYRSRGRAESAWPTFQSNSRGMLSSASHEVVSIAIEGKGLFFRLLTGRYETNAEAAQACSQLKSTGVGCLIRRINP
jgi:hypothetical protein